MMNLNKGCIEIFDRHVFLQILQEMNLNKGCIEIVYGLGEWGELGGDEP